MACASRALRPMVAMLKNSRSLARPRSIRLRRPCEHDPGGRHGVGGDSQHPGQIVGGAKRQDAEGQLGVEQRLGRRVHGAVAAAEHDEIDLVAVRADRRPDIVRAAGLRLHETHAAVAQGVERGRRPPRHRGGC